MVGTLRISKLDAAERQLYTAIKLFFNKEEPVSVHSLACAALGILEPLCEKQGQRGFVMVKNAPFIREERRKDWIKILHAAENHFKHADLDPEKILDFNPEITQLHLFEAVFLHNLIGRCYVKEFTIYTIWFMTTHPDFIKEDTRKDFQSILQRAPVDPYNFPLWAQLFEIIYSSPLSSPDGKPFQSLRGKY